MVVRAKGKMIFYHMLWESRFTHSLEGFYLYEDIQTDYDDEGTTQSHDQSHHTLESDILPPSCLNRGESKFQTHKLFMILNDGQKYMYIYYFDGGNLTLKEVELWEVV